MWRRDGVPTLTVQADVTQAASPEAVVSSLTPAVAKLGASLAKSYHIAGGGTVEECASRRRPSMPSSLSGYSSQSRY
jgi:hypothetical protein